MKNLVFTLFVNLILSHKILCAITFTFHPDVNSYTLIDKKLLLNVTINNDQPMECTITLSLRNLQNVVSEIFKTKRKSNSLASSFIIALESEINLEKSYAGTYIMRAECNDAVKSSANKEWNILMPPRRMVYMPKQFRTVEGSSLTLLCQVDSNPESTLTWIINGNNMISTNKLAIETQFQQSKLTFSDIKEFEEGKYICRAQNSVSTVNFEYDVKVRAKLAILWPILAIIVQAIVLLIFILASIYWKKIKPKSKVNNKIYCKLSNTNKPPEIYKFSDTT